MIYCPNCGQELADGTRFCAGCGTALPESEPAAVPEAKKLSLQALLEKLPFQLSPKVIGIAAACLVLVVVLILLLTGGQKNNYALYVKDGELYYTGISSIKPLEVTDDMGGSSTAAYSTQLSKDGKILFFADNVDTTSYTYDLYYRYVNKPKKDAEKLASNVTTYSVSESGKCVTYLSEGKLYQHDLKDKEKIDSDVSSYRVSEDGKKLFFLDNDGKLYFKNGSKDKEKLASDVSSIQFVDEKFSYVYYIKDENLYKQKPGKDKEKLVSDIYDVLKVYESGEFYYLEADTTEVALMDFINDDMADADAKMEEPEAPDYPYYSDYATYDEYSAAYDAYQDAYDEYWDAMDEYWDKEERDELREELEEETLEYTTYTLYYFNGKKSQEIAKDLTSEDFSYAADAPVLVYYVGENGELPEINISEVDYAWEVEDMINWGASEDGEYYMAVQGKATKLDYQDAEDFNLSDDGKLVYFLADVSEDGHGDLYQMKVSGSKPQKAKKYDTDVSFGFFLADGKFCYFKDVEDDHGELYIEKKLVDKDAYAFPFSTRSSEKGVLLYMADYDEDTNEGTLMFYKGGKSKKVENDVSSFYLTPNGEVLYLTDYDEDKHEGDLYLFKGSKSKKIDDEVSQIINTYYEED